MKNEILFLVMFFVICLMFWYIQPNKNEAIERAFVKIDTVYQTRVDYRTDTITKYKTKILKDYDTVYKYTDSVFSFGTDSQKIAQFNYHFPIIDTTKLMTITTNQAKDAIVVKEKFVRDSSLLDMQNKNVANCDSSFDVLKAETDSIKQNLPKNDSKLWKRVSLVIAGIAALSIAFNVGGVMW